MLRGTRIIQGREAEAYRWIIACMEKVLLTHGFSEVIVPSIWGLETFKDKPGMKYEFKDRKGRDICLIPEVTAPLVEMYKARQLQYNRVYYTSRCYRYERPQLGRYREFTQFGVEMFGGDVEECKDILKKVIKMFDIEHVWKENVVRGIDYYTAPGFEVECESLGAQKQIAGGGAYLEGVGWAIGVDRLMLALNKEIP